jgi:hypothetical protein
MRLARAVCLASMAMLGAFGVRCALFPSLDGLTAGEPDADAAVNEASVADAGADADADAGDALAGRFCTQLSPQPRFCDDFDDVALGPWTGTDFTNGSSVTRDGTDVVSAPNALLTVTPGGAIQVARVHLKIPSFTSLHVAYDVRIDARGSYAEIGYVRVNAPSIEDLYYFRASALPTPVSFAAEAYPPDAGMQAHNVSLVGSPTFEAWTRVELDLDLGTAPGTATILVDGKVAGTQSLESNLFIQGGGDVEIGTGYTDSTSTEFRIRYDNVTIDWK